MIIFDKPWLVQRIEKSQDNIAFPAPDGASGYYAAPSGTKLSDEARAWLRSAIPCDYMGSAEFEFNSVYGAFAKLAGFGATGIVEFPLTIKGRANGFNKVPDNKNPERDRTLFVLCPVSIRGEVSDCLKKLSKDDRGGPFRLKECTYLNEGLFGRVEMKRTGRTSKLVDSRHTGWFDLGNLWFATTDKKQMAAVKVLLGFCA